MRRLCATAQTAMETALKALNHAVPGPHPPRTHDLAALIELLPTTTAERGRLLVALPTTTAERGRLLVALRGLDLAEAAQWREMGTYPGDFAAEVVAGRSTPEHAATMANATARLTLTVVTMIEDRLGESGPSREARAELSRLVNEEASAHESHPGRGCAGRALPVLTSKDMTRRVR